jgi:hypothetical protein
MMPATIALDNLKVTIPPAPSARDTVSGSAGDITFQEPRWIAA